MPFSLRRIHRFYFIAFGVLTLAGITTFAVNQYGWLNKFSATKQAAASQDIKVPPKQAIKASPLGKGYLQRGGIWPQLHSALNAYGDRLEKPGKERVTAVGTISNADTTASEKVSVRLVFEFPDKLRIEKQKAGKTETTIYDGKTKVKIGDVIKPKEEDELEAIVFDSVDHFMAAHLLGKPVRFLGDRFRLDDGTAAKYTGSYYDIYQITEQLYDANNVKKDTLQEKLYFFNSDTHKLERITYQVVDKKIVMEVLVELAGWQTLDGQVLPTSLTRYENGKPAITLTINALALSTRIEDGTFSTTQK